MELICDLIFSPIFGLLIAKLFEGLPKKASLFLGAFITALIAAPIGCLLLISANERDLDNAIKQATVSIPLVFIFIFSLIYFGIGAIQDRREKHYIQDQFIIAKDMITGHCYQKALNILKTINDPEAREWETKVYDMALHDPDFLRQRK